MSQEIEIEYKNLLTPREFGQLCRYFQIEDDSFNRQDNHYFDTANFMLRDLGCALRIREKNGKAILTLKQPYGDDLLETHQALTNKEKQAALAGAGIGDGEVPSALQKLTVPLASLRFLGTLSTYRAERTYQGGVLVFDHSEYLQTADDELEYEVTNHEQGETVFTELLNAFHIPRRPSKNKVRRFFERKQQIEP